MLKLSSFAEPPAPEKGGGGKGAVAGFDHHATRRQGKEELFGAAAWILPHNYREAYLALARSGKVPKPRTSSRQRPPSSRVTQPAVPGGSFAALRDELPRAAKAYDAAIVVAQRVMASAPEQLLDTTGADEAVAGLVESLERNPDALLGLSRLRQRGSYACSHCVNVALLLAAYALLYGAGRHKAVAFGLAGLFHDAGKFLLPAALLRARRALTEEELALVRRHPMAGCELLAALPKVHSVMLLATLEHHERYDGSGYPKGLGGDAISEIGHLTAIADTYDALCSPRPHREALHSHRALGVLYQLRGKSLHPVLVEKFVRKTGIYPVGSVVELQDGHRCVVTGGNRDNPIKPSVTVALDPAGRSVPLRECSLAKAEAADIARCLAPETSGVDPCRVLGLLR